MPALWTRPKLQEESEQHRTGYALTWRLPSPNQHRDRRAPLRRLHTLRNGRRHRLLNLRRRFLLPTEVETWLRAQHLHRDEDDLVCRTCAERLRISSPI